VRILILIDQPPPPAAQRELDFLRGWLDSERLALVVCTLRGNAPLAEHSLAARGRYDLGAVMRLLALIRSCDVELIHALGSEAVGYATAAAFLTQTPLLASIHDVPTQRPTNWIAATAQRIAWTCVARVVSTVITPSELVKRNLWLLTSYDRDHITVLYPAFARRSAATGERDALGLPAGPLATIITPDAPDGGYEALFDVMSRLKQRVPEVTFVCAGERALVTEWQRKTAQVRPAPPIRWVIEPDDLEAIISTSDVILAHPRHDAWQSALVTAALCGKPVVASRVAGVTEIVEATVSGLLTTPDDVRDFALQAVRLLTQPEFAARLGTQAKARAEALFDAPRLRDSLTELYEATIYATR
jgi:Glycosyl transferases group 1/Glycosyltransferase Family 4